MNLQIFFAILVLGLSGHLVADQRYGGAPSITNYCVFLGIWLIVVSLVGLAGSFIDAIGGIIMLGLDALTILFTFAGGVVSLTYSAYLSQARERWWRMRCFALQGIQEENVS